MTYIIAFIALVLLTNQGNVYYEKENEQGELVQIEGIPTRIIAAMIAADFNVSQEELDISEDLLKDLDEITDIRIEPYFNHPDEDEICPIDRYRID